METINALLLTNDPEYSNRVTTYLRIYYPNINLLTIDDPEKLGDFMRITPISVVLIGDEFKNLNYPFDPSCTACSYLVANRSMCTKDDNRLFCKYSGIEEIYRHIVGLYAEVSHGGFTDKAQRICCVAGASGGAGASTVAAALASRAAANGMKVLYLSFDNFNPPISFFGEVGTGGMSDLIYSVISSEHKTINLTAKAASLIRTDASGVDYIEGCKNPNDFDELDPAKLEKLYRACVSAAEYQCVVIDCGKLSDTVKELVLAKASDLVLVSENSAVSQTKLKRTVSCLRIFDKRSSGNLCGRTSIVMNKGMTAPDESNTDGLRFAGSAPLYSDTDLRNIAEAVAKLELCGNILS